VATEAAVSTVNEKKDMAKAEKLSEIISVYKFSSRAY